MRYCNHLKGNVSLHPAGGALVVNLTFTSQYEAFQCIFKNQTLLYRYILTGAAVCVKFYISIFYISILININPYHTPLPDSYLTQYLLILRI